MLSPLGKIFSRQHIEIVFLFYPGLIFHANCCMKFQNLFSGKNKKNIINLSSAEFALSVKQKNIDKSFFLILTQKKRMLWILNRMMIIWCFTYLSTLFKSYSDKGSVIMNVSVQ